MIFPTMIMRKILLSTVTLIISGNLYSGTLSIDQWLVSKGPCLNLPLFSETENIMGKPFTSKELFEFVPIDISNYYPQQNKSLSWDSNFENKWAISGTDDSGLVNLEKTQCSTIATAYLSTYI